MVQNIHTMDNFYVNTITSVYMALIVLVVYFVMTL